LSTSTNRPAVVLLSGGLDSTTVLAIALRARYACHAISFRYGQRHAVELDAARVIAARMGVAKHLVVEIDLRQFGGSALTGEIEVPKGRSAAEMGKTIPVTYVPARNTILLALALGWAEVLDARHIFIGANAVDYYGYPDCRPEYLRAFEAMANLATKAALEGRRIEIRAPLIDLPKAEIVRRAIALGVDPAMTVSCYQADGEGRACGRCDACRLRRAGFEAAGIEDSTRYRTSE
jgi:7-cyano-7-deazaguanine synthase